MGIASDCRNTNTKSHNKGHRHRPCGNAAGVKRNRKKILRHKKSQSKHHHVKRYQKIRKRNIKQHTQKRNHQKSPHSGSHRQYQRHIGYGGHLTRQHL